MESTETTTPQRKPIQTQRGVIIANAVLATILSTVIGPILMGTYHYRILTNSAADNRLAWSLASSIVFMAFLLILCRLLASALADIIAPRWYDNNKSKADNLKQKLEHAWGPWSIALVVSVTILGFAMIYPLLP